VLKAKRPKREPRNQSLRPQEKKFAPKWLPKRKLAEQPKPPRAAERKPQWKSQRRKALQPNLKLENDNSKSCKLTKPEEIQAETPRPAIKLEAEEKVRADMAKPEKDLPQQQAAGPAAEYGGSPGRRKRPAAGNKVQQRKARRPQDRGRLQGRRRCRNPIRRRRQRGQRHPQYVCRIELI